ncbi:hypothetical protein E5288_WYG001141 [Bos mutus]|uniref:Uncharacterized protein n=1 Tax=Bos mutus TaxID=72004 RepID=A0A6B0RWF3_9CETA|nr:hypothetical protein [Bos mutus]
MSKFLLCCDCPRERYTPVLIGDADDLGPDTFISGVHVLTVTPGDFLRLPKFENTWPFYGLGKLPEIAMGADCDILYRLGRLTLPFDAVYSHLHCVYIWLQKLVKQNYKVEKRPMINYLVFVTP